MILLRPALLLSLLALPGDPLPTSFSVLAGFTYPEGMLLPKQVTDLDE